jgi:hypothetical protein
MSSIYQNARTDRQYSASTGLKIAEFNSLFSVFEKYYFPKKAEDNPYAPKPVLTDKKEALFFVLHYLKASPNYENLGLYFGISQSSAHIYIELLKPILKLSLKELKCLPISEIKMQKELEKLLENEEDIVIDVSEIRIERPDNDELQKDNYSGKKKTTP